MKNEIKEVSKDLFQRKLALKAFLMHPIYLEFRDELLNGMSYATDEMDKIMQHPLKSEDLNKINFELGVKAGLQQVLNLLTNLEDELRDNSREDA
jgi:hypothetical protein